MAESFENGLEVLFGKVEELVSSKTVIGDAIVIGDLTVLPLIDVSVGVGSGVSSGKNSAGGGMGAKITPSAILVIQKEHVQVIHVKNQDAVCKLIDMAPGLLSKLDFGAVFGRGKNKEEEKKKTVKFEEEIITEE